MYLSHATSIPANTILIHNITKIIILLSFYFHPALSQTLFPTFLRNLYKIFFQRVFFMQFSIGIFSKKIFSKNHNSKTTAPIFKNFNFLER